MLLQHLPPDARPREKLLASGPASLADAELLALLLRTGFKGTSVLQLAQNLLDDFGGLSGLLNAGPHDLEKVKGLGPAKRAEVAAVVELARRSLLREIEARPVFDSPQAVKTFLQLQMAHLDHEVFCVLFVDPQMRLIRFEQMFRGTLAKTSVYAREVVRRALDLHAAGVVLAHNHPTGVAEPSPADGWLTDQLKGALALIDVKVFDHLIIGRAGVMSFAERGML